MSLFESIINNTIAITADITAVFWLARNFKTCEQSK